MEFFHKKTNFPFMATRKVWYTLSAVLMIGCVRVVLHARPELRHRLHRRHQRRGRLPDRMRTSRRSARAVARRRLPRAAGADLRLARATSRSACSPPAKPPRCCGRSSRRSSTAVDPQAQITDARSRRSAGRRRAAQCGHRVAGGDAGADRALHHPALPHLAAVARRHPRGDARPDPGARRVLGHADAVRPGGGRGHPRGHRLFAERHRHRVRPHPRELREEPPPGVRRRRSTRPSTRRCRAPS